MSPELSPDSFRRLCGNFATGVSIVTTTRPDGSPTGLTVNSFTSVSLVPPIVSICVDRTSTAHNDLAACDRFAINILSRQQEDLSRLFAAGAERHFDSGLWWRTTLALPALRGAIGLLECRRHDTISIGDHSIVLGRVLGGRLEEGSPLIFFQGAYWDLGSP